MRGDRWIFATVSGGRNSLVAEVTARALTSAQADRFQRTLADRLGASVGSHRTSAVSNPTLVHHGVAQRAAFHILGPHGQPAADIYVGREVAMKVAHIMADLWGAPVKLVENFHDRSSDVFRQPALSVGGRLRNPSRTPAGNRPRARGARKRAAGVRHGNPLLSLPKVGEVWVANRSSERCKVVGVTARRVTYVDLHTGNRTSTTLADFVSSHAAPARRNPKSKAGKPPSRAFVNYQIDLLMKAAQIEWDKGNKAKAQRFYSAAWNLGGSHGRTANPSGRFGTESQEAAVRRLTRYGHEYGLETRGAGFQGTAVYVDFRDPKKRPSQPGAGLRALILPNGTVQGSPRLVEANSIMIERDARTGNPGDPRTRGYGKVGTPALGTITVKGTRYTVHAMSSKYTPWYLVGPRGAMYGLNRYNEKPWLFYAINAARPMGSVGKLEGVVFTGETFDQLAEFTDPGPRMNPSRSKAARARRKGVVSHRQRRAIRKAQRAGSLKSPQARYQIVSQIRRGVRRGLPHGRAANPKGRKSSLPFSVGDVVSISAIQYFGRHGTVVAVGTKLVTVEVHLIGKRVKFAPDYLRLVNPKRRGLGHYYLDPVSLESFGPFATGRERDQRVIAAMAGYPDAYLLNLANDSSTRAMRDAAKRELKRRGVPTTRGPVGSRTGIVRRAANPKGRNATIARTAERYYELRADGVDPIGSATKAALVKWARSRGLVPTFVDERKRGLRAGVFDVSGRARNPSPRRVADRKFIAWLDHTSVAVGKTADEVESYAMDLIHGRVPTAHWHEFSAGKTLKLRITTYATQRLVRERDVLVPPIPNARRRARTRNAPTLTGEALGRAVSSPDFWKTRIRPDGLREVLHKKGKGRPRVVGVFHHKVTPNPRPGLEQAKQMFSKWQDRDVEPRMDRVARPSPIPPVVTELGRLVAVTYRSDKYDGKTKDHEHVFQQPLARLVTDPEGRDLHVVRDRSRFKITADGIKH